MKLDKNKKLAIIITLAAIIVLGGITFTFFSSTVSNANNEKFQTETATMRLVFSDNDNGVSGTLNLGESIIKKFTLENTGTVDAYGKINWVDLVNTYTAQSLSWTLEQSTTEDGTYTSVGSGKVPTSSTETTAVLKNGLLVPVSTKYYYKLTITLNNLDINQSSDINANMHSKFNLQAGKQSGADKIMSLVAGEPSNTTDVITKTAPQGATCTNTLAYDGTVDNNLRYVGSNPCNYVTFNGESPSSVTVYRIMNKAGGYDGWGESFSTLETCNSTYSSEYSWDTDNLFECQLRNEVVGGWRIIGVMNNVDDGTGNLETRIKLIRNDSLGNYSWDTSDSSVNSGSGINDWTQADLKNELNGDYLNTALTSNTMWYNGYNNQKTGEYDYTKGLKASAQNLIGNTKWYLGGASFDQAYNTEGEGTASKFYGYERGTQVWGSTSGQTCNDGACPRSTSWIGKVALAYPSDYGYAVGEDVRSTCLGKKLADYRNDNCHTSQWLFSYGWLLSPTSDYSYHVFLANIGGLHDRHANDYAPAVPAVYLKSDVSISEGNGTESEPYTIS